MKKILPFILIAFISCSQEDDLNEMFLDKIENVIWTRGTNFKTFRSNPFKLFIVENGICLEFSEGDTMVGENKFSYSVEKNTTDTLKLDYRVVGQRINHCGTFTYYLDSDENLIRTYRDCTSLFDNSQILDYYKSELTFQEVCIN